MPTTATNSVAYYWDMLLYDWPLKAICTCLVSIISWFAGGIDQLVTSLFLLMVVDFALGFTRGWVEGRISGDKLKHGSVKFILYGLTVWVAVLVQGMMRAFDPSILGVKMSFAIRDWVVAYLVLNESVSCMEHLVFFKVPLPASLIHRLKHYRGCVFGDDNDRRKKP